MGYYVTTTKIIKGSISATEDSSQTATVAKAVNDYIQSLDSSDSPIIAMSTAIDGGHTLTVTIVSGENPYYGTAAAD